MWVHHATFDPRWFQSHSWALVDAVWREDLPSDWPAQPVAPAFLGDDTDRCPVLLDLRTLGPADAGELMDRLEQQVVERESTLCSLMFQSGATPQVLLRHLASRLAIDWPGSPTPRQWRYFDPGTFVQLPRVIGPLGMTWLLGPATSVLAPWAGQWAEFLPEPASAASFRLERRHREALQALGAVNRVAMMQEPPADVATWLVRCEQIERHVLRGLHSHGLQQQADLVAFASDAINRHPAFDTHPVLVQLLARLREARPEDELDYRELSASLSPEDWARICSDLDESVRQRTSP